MSGSGGDRIGAQPINGQTDSNRGGAGETSGAGKRKMKRDLPARIDMRHLRFAFLLRQYATRMMLTFKCRGIV